MVRRATEKAAERGLEARFVEADVQELEALGETFDTSPRRRASSAWLARIERR